MKIQSEKQALRESILDARKNIKVQEKEKLDFEILTILLDLNKFREAKNIFLFVSLPDEVNTHAILDSAWKSGKKIALPRIEDGKLAKMEFYSCSGWQDLVPGPLGLLQPVPSCCPAERCPDLMLVPGLAFDRSGNRVGYGKGFYDRYFAKSGRANTFLMGVAYSWQVLPTVPVENTDYPVNAICTDKGLIWI